MYSRNLRSICICLFWHWTSAVQSDQEILWLASGDHDHHEENCDYGNDDPEASHVGLSLTSARRHGRGREHQIGQVHAAWAVFIWFCGSVAGKRVLGGV